MERSDAELLVSGRPDDFGTFYLRHVVAVTAYVGRRVAQPDLAFDFVAETFARALESRERYDPRLGPGIAWLFTIARHLLIDAGRRGRVADQARQRLRLERIELDDDQLALIHERSQLDLDWALGYLSAEQREAVLRRVVSEEPYDLIAEDIGCSEQVVRQRVSRGLLTLRKRLGEQL